eukprot:6203351-Pleurochrysis_carterae.AAC.2
MDHRLSLCFYALTGAPLAAYISAPLAPKTSSFYDRIAEIISVVAIQQMLAGSGRAPGEFGAEHKRLKERLRLVASPPCLVNCPPGDATAY